MLLSEGMVPRTVLEKIVGNILTSCFNEVYTIAHNKQGARKEKA